MLREARQRRLRHPSRPPERGAALADASSWRPSDRQGLATLQLQVQRLLAWLMLLLPRGQQDAKLQRDEGCHDSGAVAVALEARPTAPLTDEVARFEKRGELGVEESSHILDCRVRARASSSAALRQRRRFRDRLPGGWSTGAGAFVLARPPRSPPPARSHQLGPTHRKPSGRPGSPPRSFRSDPRAPSVGRALPPRDQVIMRDGVEVDGVLARVARREDDVVTQARLVHSPLFASSAPRKPHPQLTDTSLIPAQRQRSLECGRRSAISCPRSWL